MQKIIWTIIILLIVIGFRPFRLPTSPTSRSDKQLLVEYHEYTCSPDFEIVAGQLTIPDNLKPIIKSNTTDINLTGDITPFENINGRNIHLLYENQFVISGEVVGVDSSARTCEKTALFKIDNWKPTKYHASFWTFDIKYFIAYFILLFGGILTSIILFARRRKTKERK